MKQSTRSPKVRKAQSVAGPEIAELLGPDPLTEALRGKIRDVLATLFDEELTQVLGAAKGQRVATRWWIPARREGPGAHDGAGDGAGGGAPWASLHGGRARAGKDEPLPGPLPAAGTSGGRRPPGGVPGGREQPSDQGGAGPAAARAGLQERGVPDRGPAESAL